MKTQPLNFISRATLVRTYLADQTIGVLTLHFFLGKTVQLATIELPWLDNNKNVSCIPAGNYDIMRDYSGAHRYFIIADVPGRTNIEMHTGNYTHQTEGCILVGQGLFPTGDSPAFKLKSSKKALDYMIENLAAVISLTIS